jgi:hypothetical protein
MGEDTFRQYHDMGGELDKGAVKPSEHEIPLWQKRIEATLRALALRPDPVLTIDEMRRGIEMLPPNLYDELGYYERWITALKTILVEKGVLTQAELDAKVAEIEARGPDKLPGKQG